MSTRLMIDPNRQYHQHSPGVLLESLGLLPHWVNCSDPSPLDKQLEEHYAQISSCYWMKDATISRDGVYEYEGDPPMQPIGLIERSDTQEKVWFYPYAIVGYVKDDAVRWCRMD